MLPSASAAEIAPHASTRLDRWVLARIQGLVRTAPVTFTLWDGYEIPPVAGPPVGSIVFRNRAALAGWVWDPELNFGETYMSGAVEIHGDLFVLLEAIYRALEGPGPRRWRRVAANDTNAARHNVHHHYDLGNDFYRLWLDREMLYTCAYFPTPEATLEDAQIAKMDLVCRKLRLRPASAWSRPAAAGARWRCSWRGSTASRCARSTSRPSRSPTRASARSAEGLDDRVEFVEDDYRNVSGHVRRVRVGRHARARRPAATIRRSDA